MSEMPSDAEIKENKHEEILYLKEMEDLVRQCAEIVWPERDASGSHYRPRIYKEKGITFADIIQNERAMCHEKFSPTTDLNDAMMCAGVVVKRGYAVSTFSDEEDFTCEILVLDDEFEWDIVARGIDQESLALAICKAVVKAKEMM